jgi:hypothetical protein
VRYQHFDQLPALVADRFVSARPHPRFPLRIYNYTSKCAALKPSEWSDALQDCRGLILSEDGLIVGRPFRKFWNYEQVLDSIPAGEPFTIWEKLDGSLGVIANYGGNLIVATRGSFESDQAQWAAEWLRSRFPGWLPPLGETHLVEIVYPQNRIVVDYGAREELVLLDVLGSGGAHCEEGFRIAPLRRAAQIDAVDIGSLLAQPDRGREGFVVKWRGGFMAKLKFDEYKRLHWLLTQCSTRAIWERLRAGSGIQELLDRVPADFAEWVTAEIAALREQFESIATAARTAFNTTPGRFESRKDFAMWAKEQPNPGLLFSLLDGKSIDDTVWRLIEPKWAASYKKETE